MFNDVEALGKMMVQLMERGTENERLGLQHPDRWSMEAVRFLPLTMTASPSELAK
jgi:hypothetical protein